MRETSTRLTFFSIFSPPFFAEVWGRSQAFSWSPMWILAGHTELFQNVYQHQGEHNAFGCVCLFAQGGLCQPPAESNQAFFFFFWQAHIEVAGFLLHDWQVGQNTWKNLALNFQGFRYDTRCSPCWEFAAWFHLILRERQLRFHLL